MKRLSLVACIIKKKGEGPFILNGVMKKITIKISFDGYSIAMLCEKYVGKM